MYYSTANGMFMVADIEPPTHSQKVQLVIFSIQDSK